MYNEPRPQNAVAAIRVSTTKQGTQGDSPEAQREQLERFATNRNIVIKKLFLFLESASKEQQPMQEAIDYCKDPKHNIQLFVVKSIDRFTRGGSYSYSNLKMQLDQSGVRLIDIYGIIGAQKVNTLEHLNVSYKWSVYDPTKNSEILEAERASDEKRDIMSRMIGAQIRYARLGYWVRRAPMGFINATAETMHGRRGVLEPDLKESLWITKMFELRCRGTVSDALIVEEVNNLGFKTRVSYLRSTQDRTRIIAKKGGTKLTIRRLHQYIQSPIYAGINAELWLQGSPIKCKFPGLISIEDFNKANHGKIAILDGSSGIIIEHYKPERLSRNRKTRDLFPYKQVVMCPLCEKPLLGSSSRGHMGKYYPAYHCSTRIKERGHYFRVPNKVFDKTIENFIGGIQVAPAYVSTVSKTVLAEWVKREKESHRDDRIREQHVAELRAQAKFTAEKIGFLSSETTIKYIERGLLELEAEIAKLDAEIASAAADNRDLSPSTVKTCAKYFIEHPEALLLDQADPDKKANYFGLLFEKPPTYEDLAAAVKFRAEVKKLSNLFLLVSA